MKRPILGYIKHKTIIAHLKKGFLFLFTIWYQEIALLSKLNKVNKKNNLPVFPGVHMHIKLPTPSLQVAPLKQAASRQSFILILQSGPVQPLTQIQE